MNNFLPDGWEEAEVDQLVTYKKGKKPQRLEKEPFEGSLPYLDIKVIEAGVVDQYADIESSSLADENDLLVVWDGSRAGWIGLGRLGAIGSTVMAVRPIQIDKLYFYYFLQSQYQRIQDQRKGIGVPHVDSKVFGRLIVPIAPLMEQQRIVELIEERMKQVEQSRKQFLKLKEELKQYRQEVITSAILGQLTEDWRGSDEYKKVTLRDGEIEIPINWQIENFGDLIETMRNGLSKKPINSPTNTPILRISAVRPGSVDINDHKFLNTSDVPTDYLLKEHDLLFTRYNGSLEFLGICGIIRGLSSRSITYPDKLIRVRTSTKILSPEYAQLFYLSKYARELILAIVKSSAGLNGISGKSLQSLQFILPPIDEQKEILSRVNKQMFIAENVEANYNKAIAEVESLPQIILGKAFAGQLIEQNPNDEPASLLLKQIYIERDLIRAVVKVKKDKTQRIEKMTESKLLDIIQRAFADRSFTFDELRENTTKEYEVLRDELYGLIETDKTVVHQFDSNTELLTFRLTADAHTTD